MSAREALSFPYSRFAIKLLALHGQRAQKETR